MVSEFNAQPSVPDASLQSAEAAELYLTTFSGTHSCISDMNSILVSYIKHRNTYPRKPDVNVIALDSCGGPVLAMNPQ